MPGRPAAIWKTLSADRRLAAAEAFWRDDQPDAEAQQVEALVALARRLNFRTRSVQALPVETRARHLARMSDVSDMVASRLLIAYHLAAQRPLMRAFLDALGIAHEDGLITAETVAAPDAERLAGAVAAIREAFPEADTTLYLRTLAALDEDTWAGLAGV